MIFFLKHTVEGKYLSEALGTFYKPLVLQKVKEDYFSQLDDYDEPFCERRRELPIGNSLLVNDNTRMGLVCSNSNPLISLIPPNCLKF